MTVRVVKQVTAEVRAKTDVLDRELQAAEQRLGRTKRQVEGLGGAASGLGNKYGAAGLQIARATEQIGRTGQVAGAASAQILQAGSSIAFAFGPAGAAIGALSIFALAVVETFSRTRRELDETAKKSEETIARLVNAGDVEGLKKRARDLFVGTPAEQFRDGIVARERRLAELRDPKTLNPFNFFSRQKAIEEEEEALRPLRAEYDRLAQAIQNLQAPTTSGTNAPISVTGVDPEAERRALVEVQREVLAFGKDFQRLLLTEFQTPVEQVAAAFDELIGRGIEVGGKNSPAVARLRELREVAISAATAIAAADAAITDIEFARTRGSDGTAAEVQRLNEAARTLDAILRTLVPGSKQYLAVQQSLLKVDRERAKIVEGIGNASGSGSGRNAARTTADLAREIQQAADGALQLAAAFGAVERGAVSVLRAVGQIAGNIPALQTALAAGNGFGVLGAALPIAGALASLFGESPAARQRNEELRRNTEALEELTARAGLLGIGLSGSGAAGAAASATAVVAAVAARRQRFIDALGLERGSLASIDARDVARGLGLSLSELDQVAAQLGITLNGSVESFQQLADALADSITKLGEFGTDLESARRQAQVEADIFGITDPAARLNLLLGALGGRSSALDSLTAGLDLNTAEGRQQARENAQALFEILKAGGATLDAEALGGLTGEQLIQALLDLVNGLNDVDESLGVNTSTATEVDRAIRSDRTQITVDQASRLLGLTSTQVNLTREIRDLLAAALGASVSALSLPGAAAFTAGAAGIVINQSIELTITGAVEPERIASETMDAIVEHVRRALGQDVTVRRIYAGQAVTS